MLLFFLVKIKKNHILPCSFTLLSPPLELKQPWPVWKTFENLRFSLVNRDFRANLIFKACPEMTHSNSNRRDPSENFFLSSRRGGGGGDNKVNKYGKVCYYDRGFFTMIGVFFSQRIYCCFWQKKLKKIFFPFFFFFIICFFQHIFLTTEK